MTRMCTYRFQLLFLCLFYLLSIPASEAARTTLRVGLFNMPPFYSQAASGEAEGELIITLDAVLEHLGYDWQPTFMSVAEALKGVVSGNVDLLMIIRHPMVEGKAIYGQVPMGSMNLQAYHREEQGTIKNLSDLRGQRVALLRGYGYGGLLNQLLASSSALKVSVIDDHQEAFLALDAKKVDVVLDYAAPGQRTLNRLGFTHITGDMLQKKEIFFVVSNKVADGEELIEKLQAALTLVKP